MAISLSKGEKVSLTKDNPGLNLISVGLGWDTQKFDGQSDFDLDASVFMVGEDGKTKDTDFIYYRNKSQQGIEHKGDNRTGEGDGDDEVIEVKLKELAPHIRRLSFVVSIDKARERDQSFGQVSNAYIKIRNGETGEELLNFDLGEDFSTQTGVIAGEIYLHNTEWKFQAVGQGFDSGLEGLCNHYGLEVE